MARVDPRNRTRYWWASRVSGLSLMHADLTDHDFPPHSHDAMVVVVTEMGGCSGLKSRGIVEEVEPRKLFVFNPAEPHSSWMGWSRRWRYRSLYLTRSGLDDLASDLGVTEVPYFTSNVFTDSDLIAGIHALHRALEQDGDAFHDREAMLRVFGRLFNRHGHGKAQIPAAPRDRPLLERVIATMRERYAEPLRLEEVAQRAGLTSFQVIGLFKRTIGLTPHAYLTQVRLSAACGHLRRGVPLAEVPPLTGFYDQSAMTRHFKRCYGITPLQFARAAQG